MGYSIVPHRSDISIDFSALEFRFQIGLTHLLSFADTHADEEAACDN